MNVRELYPCQQFDPMRGSFMVSPRVVKSGARVQTKKGQVVMVSATWPVRDGFVRHPSSYEFITRLAGVVLATRGLS